MKAARYLDVKAFCEEARALRVVSRQVDAGCLERLEEQRSLIPRLRLRYPDDIERRWFADDRPDTPVHGSLEPDGPRWDAACALETARHQLYRRSWADPSATPHPFDDPEPRWTAFFESPALCGHRPWKGFDVALHAPGEPERVKTDTIVTYYSAWQILQFAEVATMGVTSFLNLVDLADQPTPEQIAAAPQWIGYVPFKAMRGFAAHADTLDAIVWFAEEAAIGFAWATRADHNRRMLAETERAEIMRLRLWAADAAPKRFGIQGDAILAALKFLCERWAHWNYDGRPLIADAYRTIAAEATRLLCLATGASLDAVRDQVGRAGPYLKPIFDMIWPDWEKDRRADARDMLAGFNHPTAILRANFSEELIERFLDFIEQNALHSLYWRLESSSRHSFEGNNRSLEGQKSDVQGLGVVVEHIAAALGATQGQLNGKFKHLWKGDNAVARKLKDPIASKTPHRNDIDLAWWETRCALGADDETAADLTIAYAIRGGAHRVIQEDDPIKLERMLLILLRAAVRTFDVATRPPAE